MIITISIASCDNKATEIIYNEAFNEETTQTEKLSAYYYGYDESLIWKNIKNIDYYELYINNENKIKTEQDFYYLGHLTEGQYSVKINAIKNSKIIASDIVDFYKGIPEEKLKTAEIGLKCSIVEVHITRYNVSLGILKKDEETELAYGFIYKNNENEYWTVSYSKLLRSSKSFDKTEIIIKDEFGNEYEGIEDFPTNIEERILSIVKFKSNKKLPTVTLGTETVKDQYIVHINNTDNNATVGKISGNSDRSKINNIYTKSILVETNLKFAIIGTPIFNSNFEFIGIIVPNSNDTTICFMQLKEILGYIDIDLQKECGEWINR